MTIRKASITAHDRMQVLKIHRYQIAATEAKLPTKEGALSILDDKFVTRELVASFAAAVSALKEAQRLSDIAQAKQDMARAKSVMENAAETIKELEVTGK